MYHAPERPCIIEHPALEKGPEAEGGLAINRSLADSILFCP